MNNFSLNNQIDHFKRDKYLLSINSLVKVVHDMNVFKYKILKNNELKWNNEFKKYLGKPGIVLESNHYDKVKILFPYIEYSNNIVWFPISVLVVNDETINFYKNQSFFK